MSLRVGNPRTAQRKVGIAMLLTTSNPVANPNPKSEFLVLLLNSRIVQFPTLNRTYITR